jgi:hypothetical protein
MPMPDTPELPVTTSTSSSETVPVHAPPTDPSKVSVAASEPALAPIAADADAEPQIGRYRLSELTAMRGRRGRKPPEFYTAFPDLAAGGDGKPAAAKDPGVTKVPRQPKVRAVRTPQVSSAIIGDHTIDQLLAMIGTTGRKPIAYDILQAAAQVFADAGALDLPAPTDPLVVALGAASPAVRELVGELLRQVPAKRPRAKKEAAEEVPG